MPIRHNVMQYGDEGDKFYITLEGTVQILVPSVKQLEEVEEKVNYEVTSIIKSHAFSNFNSIYNSCIQEQEVKEESEVTSSDDELK